MKTYIIEGYKCYDNVKIRFDEILSKIKVQPELMSIQLLPDMKFALIISEDLVEYLDETEREKIKEHLVQRQIQVINYIPVLYRYMDKIWLDAFFEDGSLRLSSFKRFQSYKDEQKGDKSEGRNILTGVGGGHTVIMSTGFGIDAYILSTSMLFDESLKNAFNANSCLVIENPLSFISEIAKQIPYLSLVNYGPCYYKLDKNIRRNIKDFKLDDLKVDPNSKDFSFDKFFELAHKIGQIDVFYNKLIKYQHQHEYRLLWHTSSEEIQDFIDIKIPEAIKFCHKIDLEA